MGLGLEFGAVGATSEVLFFLALYTYFFFLLLLYFIFFYFKILSHNHPL